MYTNTIIGSYNAIANSEHHAMIMKPPIKKQPRSKDKGHGHSHGGHTPRGTSEDSTGATSVHSVLSPTSVNSVTSPVTTRNWNNVLPGLELLASVQSIVVTPDKIFSPEVSKIGFTVDEIGGEGKTRPLLKCMPAESSTSRSLLLQTLEGKTILQVHTQTPYCCSWYKNLEARIVHPSEEPFGIIQKTAFGPLKLHRKFLMSCSGERVVFEVIAVNGSELVIKQNGVAVGKVVTRGVDCRAAYSVTFLNETELSPHFKALFLLFAVFLHIAFAEKLNTCFGMGLCCVAGSAVAAWVLCLL